ncbi:hypothetical protein AXF21_02070 [Eubacterium minutum ATCC 700079]|nr:hypothetical protein AXF21_02070 [Eubacterium minutum ATCC 700079]
MSGKNALRMIFFALALMVIIGGGYTADCVFAESGEHEVTLDISGVTSENLKIFDKNGKEVEKVFSEKLPKKKIEGGVAGKFAYVTEVRQWKLKLTPGESTFKV